MKLYDHSHLTGVDVRRLLNPEPDTRWRTLLELLAFVAAVAAIVTVLELMQL
jgi:hypothetical protein